MVTIEPHILLFERNWAKDHKDTVKKTQQWVTITRSRFTDKMKNNTNIFSYSQDKPLILRSW